MAENINTPPAMPVTEVIKDALNMARHIQMVVSNERVITSIAIN